MRPNQQQWFMLVDQKVYLSIGSEEHVDAARLHESDGEIIALLDASPHPLVHLIYDAREIQSLPPLNEVRKLKYPSHPRMGYNVTIGALQHPVIRFLVGMTNAITGARSKDVKSLKEACDYLLERDPSLPRLNIWDFPPDMHPAGV